MKWPRMKAGRPPTELELGVLRRVANGESPWSPWARGSSRTQSQALSRLKQLGYICVNDDGGYEATETGRAFL